MARWLLIAVMSLSLNACSSDDDEYEHEHHRRRTTVDCSENVTCGTCTPVVGCGWCQFGDGSGKCASGPSQCGEVFRWNWNPEDCPATAATDAGPVDAPVSTDAPSAEDAAAETSADDAADAVAEETTPTDTAATECTAPSVPTGCAQSFGGTLCGAGQYTLGCATTVKPVGCTAKLTEGSTTHYCCSCK